MQGWRLNMEDDHISEANFTSNSSLFAVFDGHGGAEVARFCGKYFGPTLKKNKKFSGETDIAGALIDTFLEMDVLLQKPEHRSELLSFKNEPGDGESMAGCTANVVLIHKNKVYCANSGDSRCICWDGKKVHELSTDHKPDLPVEKERISKAGGFIIEGRVNGNLNLSRALGDLEYKKNPSLKPEEQLISPKPDIVTREITKQDQFLVMGCDGIWEIMTMEEICKVAENGIKSTNGNLVEVAGTILDKGLAPDTSNGVGCDNMSCIVIKLNC